MGAVAGAEPASEITGFTNWDAAEVGADACCVDRQSSNCEEEGAFGNIELSRAEGRKKTK